ncbi:MAG: glycosyltransferase [Gammaproteobacteria bacterium]|nr:glycosyltransferase [Gammaproteobacteria bacterium]MBU0788324.1 glycosyltransferase [Gammaproteobacteria bacterium]MBU0815179.1 glycosyltransferase [Gammaproteobacteria bacterium]MBU1785713.1 glycosyltransferase [Gammaproteobacteria bacterium]
MDMWKDHGEEGAKGKKLPHRILHVVDDFSTGNTGVTSSVRQIAQWQAQHCDWVGVHATGPVDLPVPAGVSLILSPAHRFTSRWRYPAHGSKGLLDIVREHRVTHLHVHEFWRGGFVVAMRVAHTAGIPVVLSAHGATSPWALYGQGWVKRIKKQAYWHLFARHLLLSWAALHAVTPLEQRHMRQFFGREPQAIIPNALHEIPDLMSFDGQGPFRDRRRLVFLGRLHPVKGVDGLIQAFHRARLRGEWELLIVGPEEIPAYAQELKDMAKEGERAGDIQFLEACHGAEKWGLLASAWVVVVPSHTEVIGMVNLEAATAGAPTITTTATGLEEWTDSGGVLIDHTLDSLIFALEHVGNWGAMERLRRGEQCRSYVMRKYSMDSVGREWLRFYARLADQVRE